MSIRTFPFGMRQPLRNLTDEERERLLYQAYETAKEGNLEKEIGMCQEIIKQNYKIQ